MDPIGITLIAALVATLGGASGAGLWISKRRTRDALAEGAEPSSCADVAPVTAYRTAARDEEGRRGAKRGARGRRHHAFDLMIGRTFFR